jgi:thymidylate synthase ThyX
MLNEKFAPNFETTPFADADRKLIERFFTNLDKSVYAVTILPAEVIGALCSMASRAKEDLREILLKQYIKAFLEENTEYSKSLKAFIDFLQEHPAEVIFANPKAREFYVKWLAQFGDDSIAQMSGAHLVYSGISQLAIAQIEDQRIGLAPIEKSTRYVDYSSKVAGSYRYYTDPTLADIGMKEEYVTTMDFLFDTYTDLLAKYTEFLKQKFPTEEERVVKAKAFDTVRTLLPMATLSQVALFGNGQAFEYFVNRSLDHVLGEIRWTAESAVEELGKIIPAFLRRVQEDGAKKYRAYKSGMSLRMRNVVKEMDLAHANSTKKETAPYVKILEFDPQAEDKIIAGLLYPEMEQPMEQVLGTVKGFSNEKKEQVLKAAMEGRLYKYYKTPRAFENAFLKFEVSMNIGAWRDLRRHRMHTQYRQKFSTHSGFDVPEGLVEAGLDKPFIEAIQRAEALFLKIEKVNPDLAQYTVPMASRVRFIQYQNIRAFFWEVELRTIPQGHPDYRTIEQEKAKLFQKMYPLLSKYLLVDMEQYDFARRGDSDAIKRKEEQLKVFFEKK